MHISDNGINLIKRFEGFRDKAYKCPAGVWTIGYGHTYGVKPTDIINKAEATELLIKDVFNCEGVINHFVKKTLNQGQYDALCSFIFNVGSGNFQRSSLLRKLNQADYEGAANEFQKWVYSKGKKLPGLVKRRTAERELFISS